MGWTSFQIHKTTKSIDVIREELEQDDLESYSREAKRKLKQLKKGLLMN